MFRLGEHLSGMISGYMFRVDEHLLQLGGHVQALGEYLGGLGEVSILKPGGHDLSSPISMVFHADDKPKPHHIIRVVGQSGKEVVVRDQLASQWEDLLLQLEFEPASSTQHMIRNINRNCRGEVEEACREVLLKWLSGHPSNCQPITWRTLIAVIKKMDHSTLACELEQELLP